MIGQVDEQTRLVALASFVSGYRWTTRAWQGARQRGILFCLDGIQTLARFRPRWSMWTCFAADAHKWLLGPCAGIMYVRKGNW